jgi:hypothetical protein
MTAVLVASVSLSALGADCEPVSGNALWFDGNDLVTFGTVSSLGEHTIEAWVRPSAVGSPGGVIVGHIAGPGTWCGQGTMLTGDADNLCFDLDPAGCGTNNFLCSEGDYLDTWVHVAGTFDGTTGRLYIDGVLVEERSGVSFTPSNWMTAGALVYANGPQGFFGGEIDEIRIWSVAREAEEIQATMHQALAGDEPGLVGYWNFDEGVGQQATDLAGNADGVLGYGSAIEGSDPSWTVSGAPLCAADDPVAGQVDGFTPQHITCRNLTTGQIVQMRYTESSWDCEELGLVVRPGDRVATGALGSVD